ncbi:MAG: hypothetical protein HY863_02340 [Chloroflexi bacterium]|nr:hypothetical protein [Chloroflexota bacterium]
MTIQTLNLSANLCRFTFALPIAQPIQANPYDYGFDFDEDELGRELLAALPASLSIQPFPEVDADEFEKTFHYFLS